MSDLTKRALEQSLKNLLLQKQKRSKQEINSDLYLMDTLVVILLIISVFFYINTPVFPSPCFEITST